MVSIRKGMPQDLEGVMKLFRRGLVSLHEEGNDMYDYGYPTEEDYKTDLEEGRAFLIKEKGRIVAYVSYDRNLKGSFFPNSPDEKGVYEMLDEIGYKGEEEVIILHRLLVDPSCRRSGYAHMLMMDFMARFKGKLLVLAVYHKSKAAMRFYEKLNLKNHGTWDFDYGLSIGPFYLFSKYL